MNAKPRGTGKGSFSISPAFSSKARATSGGRGEAGAARRARTGALFATLQPLLACGLLEARPVAQRGGHGLGLLLGQGSRPAAAVRPAGSRSFTWVEGRGALLAMRADADDVVAEGASSRAPRSRRRSREKAAFSNSGTMRPRAKQPRSPPSAADPLSSETVLREGREVGPGLELGRGAVSASFWPRRRGGPPASSGVGLHLDQDVAGADLLRLLELVPVLLVVGLESRLGDGDARLQGVGVDEQVGDHALLGDLVASFRASKRASTSSSLTATCGLEAGRVRPARTRP